MAGANRTPPGVELAVRHHRRSSSVKRDPHTRKDWLTFIGLHHKSNRWRAFGGSLLLRPFDED